MFQNADRRINGSYNAQLHSIIDRYGDRYIQALFNLKWPVSLAEQESKKYPHILFKAERIPGKLIEVNPL
jgi:hypothetical protein